MLQRDALVCQRGNAMLRERLVANDYCPRQPEGSMLTLSPSALRSSS
jgi:hypothetical protein